MFVVKKLLNSRYITSICLLSLCFALPFCSSLQANELVNLALHDEVYTFVKRLTARDLIKKRPHNSQPLARSEIAEVLIEVTEKQQSGQNEVRTS